LRLSGGVHIHREILLLTSVCSTAAKMNRFTLAAVGASFLWALGLQAQPVDPSDYFPLAVGNLWEYEHELYRPQTESRPVDQSRTAHEVYRIVSSSVEQDTLWYTIEFTEWGSSDLIVERDSVRVRYDEESESVVGGAEYLLLGLPRCLDLPPGMHDGSECWTNVGTGDLLDRNLFGAETVPIKSFSTILWSFDAVAGVGIVTGGGGCEPCNPLDDRDEFTLRFARIEGSEYGARIIGREEAAEIPDPRTFSVYPNPTRGLIQLEGVAGGAGAGARGAFHEDRLEAFDLLGRRVLDARLTGSGQEVDLGSLPAGIYLLKVGEQSTTVVVDSPGGL